MGRTPSEGRARARARTVRALPRDAQIANLGAAVVEHNVERLEVAVDDAVGVEVLHAGDDRHEPLQHG
eukprot:5038085-Prymnesium_polylepis.1